MAHLITRENRVVEKSNQNFNSMLKPNGTDNSQLSVFFINGLLPN